MVKKITEKNIEQTTNLMIDLIAETVAEKAVAAGMKVELDKWDTMNQKQRDELDELFKAEVKVVEEYLVLRAETTFQHNESFNKGVRAKGNKGRDYLYMFMHHWVGIHDGHVTHPNSYKRGMENYYKAMALFEEQHK